MFCKTCGQQIGEEQRYCHRCGTLNIQPTAKKKSPYLIIGIFIAMIAAIGVTVYIMKSDKDNSESGASQYYEVLEKMCDMYESLDASRCVSIVPDDFFDALLKEKGKTKEEFILQSNENMHRHFSKYGDFDMTYEILDEKNGTESDIEECKNQVKKFLNCTLDIEELKMLEVDFIVMYNGEIDKITDNVTLFKIGSRWYTMP